MWEVCTVCEHGGVISVWDWVRSAVSYSDTDEQWEHVAGIDFTTFPQQFQ